MANIGGSSNDAFLSGVSHLTASGRANDQSLTLGDSGLDQTSQHWDSMSPRGVLQTALGGSPSETDAGIEYGQQALGNRDDQDMAETSIQRSMRLRAAGIGSDDGVS
jgi:hypothetical protein